MEKKTVVFGASENPSRYSNMAVLRLREYGHPVIAVGRSKGRISDVEILDSPNQIPAGGIDTVTLYLNPDHQKGVEDVIFKLKPKRVIFNPGTENPEFEARLQRQGIEPLQACTLVLLSTNQY